MNFYLNPVMLLVIMSSCANALPEEDRILPINRLEQVDPEEDRDADRDRHRFAFETYESEECWDMAMERAWEMMGKGPCIEAFMIVTGIAPREFAASGDYVMVFPKEWSHPQYAGYTTCEPPWISIDYKMAMDFGPTATGATIVHEMVHAASCDMWWGDPDAMEGGEKLAYSVQLVCENAD